MEIGFLPTVYQEYIVYGLFFWALIFGFIFGWNIRDETPEVEVIMAQVPPTQAPDSEAFE